VITGLLRSGKLDFIPENDYKTAGKIAWMREGGNGKYVFPDAVQKKKDFDDLMFKHHPFAAAAIASLDLYILNNALMASYRETMRNLVGKGTKVRVLWGDGDQTVPYRLVREPLRVVPRTAWGEWDGPSMSRRVRCALMHRRQSGLMTARPQTSSLACLWTRRRCKRLFHFRRRLNLVHKIKAPSEMKASLRLPALHVLLSSPTSSLLHRVGYKECEAITETITLPSLGHESIYEDPAPIVAKTREFFA